MLPNSAQAVVPGLSRRARRSASDRTGQQLPPAVRSRQQLRSAARASVQGGLPLTQHGTTYNLAQVVRWLDAEHFAVGRWDGTLSVFDFETAPYVGALITDATESPSANGVRMITKVGSRRLITSNDSSSLAVWDASRRGWGQLKVIGTVPYDPALGAATSGIYLPRARRPLLVVGHDGGFVTTWSVTPSGLRFIRTIDLRNPTPINPWNLHAIYGIDEFGTDRQDPRLVCGSDDGYLSIVGAATGRILRQMVFNPAAQRGINSVTVDGDRLLAANCSVGANDSNLWYFTISESDFSLTLRDHANLILDPTEVQVFNFDVTWGRYGGQPCWFASTEEGALWMGTADTKINVLGSQLVDDGSIGAALAYAEATGRLAAVIHNLHQFSVPA